MLDTASTVANSTERAVERQRSKSLVSKASVRNSPAKQRYVRGTVGQDFDLDSAHVLGKGCSGSVVKGVCRRTGYEVAIKSYCKRGMSREDLHALKSEANIYMGLDHENIAKLLHVYEDNDNLSFVMELCSGKELFHRLQGRGVFSEQEAQHAVQQMCETIAHNHQHGIVHRDLKLENWLYEHDKPGASLKLIDFGFAVEWDQKRPLNMRCGTMDYMAPEVYMESYTNKCDMWSLGVIAYALLDGHLPFCAKTDSDLRGKIQSCELTFPQERWGKISELARDFVEKLLTLRCEDRMSAEECLRHPWLQTMVATAEFSPELSELPRTRSALNVCLLDAFADLKPGFHEDESLCSESTTATI
jgi:calcium-dependent protein kinase